MSVLACSRSGCGNIMCDRYSHTHGYICSTCYEELVKLDPDNVESFMDTTPAAPIDNLDLVEEKFNRLFPSQV